VDQARDAPFTALVAVVGALAWRQKRETHEGWLASVSPSLTGLRPWSGAAARLRLRLRGMLETA
jgi:hypothetical protein